jgi:hypothetical protein
MIEALLQIIREKDKNLIENEFQRFLSAPLCLWQKETDGPNSLKFLYIS